MGYLITKASIQNTDTHLQKLKNKVKFNKKVINENIKKVRFIRKLLNKILSKASKNLKCHQLQKLLYINCKKMQEKMQSYVNASPSPDKSNSYMQINTRKRKRTQSILKDNNTLTDMNNVSFNSVINISTNSSVRHYDSDSASDDTDKSTHEELHELESKDIRVKETLRKIAKIRKLPDYKRIENILNMNDALTQKKKRSLNSIVTMKKPIPFWNTYSYLLREIENCVAKKYWSKLTTLLIYLSGAVKKCEPLLLKATIINFISNPNLQVYELLGEFLKECYSCRTEEDIENLLTQLFHIQPKINTLI